MRRARSPDDLAYAAGFGFVYDLGLPVGEAIVVTAPYLIA